MSEEVSRVTASLLTAPAFAPHSGQNFAPAASFTPQFEHTGFVSTFASHPVQNFAFSGSLALHVLQFIFFLLFFYHRNNFFGLCRDVST
jgi:hypothetical protein